MSVQLHFHLVKSIKDALDEVFDQGKYADKVIEKCFKSNRKWGSRDRKFFAETLYEIVRHKRKLEFIAMDTDKWNVIAAYLLLTYGELPDWMFFDGLDVKGYKSRIGAVKQPEVEHSFPDWLNDLGKFEFGFSWADIMKALNQPAEVFLRTNTLRVNNNQLIAQLAKEGIEAEKVFNSCLKLKERKNVFTTKAFEFGYFEVQDAASQMVAPLLEVEPGMRVVDACAGAGGKSLHIATLMQNKGKIIALDIHDWKLNELRTRATRNKIDIIETKLIDTTKTIKRLEGSFDRVLLDVPCSGMGVIRRNPDTKWKLTPEEISRLVDLQMEILTQYPKMCKPGGLMVYATCSILHRENEEQIKSFLETEEGKNWTLKKEMRVWPHIDKFDGFYAAVLVKNSKKQ